MDKIQKFLLKLTSIERENILFIIEKILIWQLEWLDVKKLQNEENLYRVRKWKIRIVFSMVNKEIQIIDINYRWQIYR